MDESIPDLYVGKRLYKKLDNEMSCAIGKCDILWYMGTLVFKVPFYYKTLFCDPKMDFVISLNQFCDITNNSFLISLILFFAITY